MACASPGPELHAAARRMAEQTSWDAARRMWKAVENLCLLNTGVVLSTVCAIVYDDVDNSVLQTRMSSVSVEVASRGPHDRVQETLQVVSAVEGDADDSAVCAEHLDLYVSLQTLSELVLYALQSWRVDAIVC